jgi:hypothetical protein
MTSIENLRSPIKRPRNQDRISEHVSRRRRGMGSMVAVGRIVYEYLVPGTVLRCRVPRTIGSTWYGTCTLKSDYVLRTGTCTTSTWFLSQQYETACYTLREVVQ